jgi:hypothetical protein
MAEEENYDESEDDDVYELDSRVALTAE